jgi:hypothetical protein
MIKDYPLPFDIPVYHIAFKRPSVLCAELVTIHFGGQVGGGTVPRHRRVRNTMKRESEIQKRKSSLFQGMGIMGGL